MAYNDTFNAGSIQPQLFLTLGTYPIIMAGKKITSWRLAVVATPIGNLEDITLRALRILKEADIIAAEDTRRTLKLCRHYDIKARLISYHSHSEHKKTDSLLELVRKGNKVALVSDSGTPVISDPGYLLVREAVNAGIEPKVVPGPSALTYAVVASNLPVDRFEFHGFPPRRTGKRRNFLMSIKDCDSTVFLFESVHRINRLIEDICSVYGGDTEIAVIREATKMHEERLRGKAGEIRERYASKSWKGELVVGIDLRT